MKSHASFNRCFSLLWSESAACLVPVPETARSGGKGAGQRGARRHNGVLAAVALSGAMGASAWAQAPPAANQLPTGGQVVRGTAVIGQSSTAQSASMVVNQSSARAVIDWRNFNVGAQAQVRFNQPNAQSATLNRVNDANPSQIFGRIESNGQVILSNASGVYFSPSSRLDLGALTATTHSISADDFMAGGNTYSRNGALGRIVNEGQIHTALGGYVALLAPEVQNSGVIVARAGTVALASGEHITLNLSGQGGLAGITATASAVQSLIENRHAIEAPDGLIILSGVALNTLQAGLVKNSGTLEANSLTHTGGKVLLEGDEITLSAGSKIEAKGPTGGGTVLVGGDWQGSGDMRQATQVTMAAGASIDASATVQGDGGKVVLWSDIHNAGGVTQVDGRIDAKSAGAGQGGQVETSGHQLHIGDGAQVNTNGGQWLLDPYDFTVAPSGGNITGTSLSTLLASNNITLTASTTANTSDTDILKYGSGSSSALGDIYINDKVSWGGNYTLTLAAANNVYVNAPMNPWGSSKLTVTTGASGNLLMGLNKAPESSGGGFYGRIDFTTTEGGSIGRTGINIFKVGANFYTLIASVGAAADYGTAPGTMTLQGIQNASFGTYAALATDIDASSTVGWNSGAGFQPVRGQLNIFNGLGHVVKGLTINSSASSVGLFKNPTSILNVGIDAASTITSTYSTANTTTAFENTTAATGALLGYGYDNTNYRFVYNSFSNASVTAVTGAVGGLVGTYISGTIDNSASNGNVTVNVGAADTTGTVAAGGLVGAFPSNAGGTISNSVATGNVTVAHGSTSGATQSLYAGGFVGFAYGNSTSKTLTSDVATGAVSITGADIYRANATNGTTIRQPYGAVAGGFVGVGVFVGNGTNLTFQKSSSKGEVSANLGVVGGFAGYLYSSTWGPTATTVQIKESFSTGNVSVGTADANNILGGLIGAKYSNQGRVIAINNYTTSNITAQGSLGFVGKFLGKNLSSSAGTGDAFTYNYSLGTISGGATTLTLGGTTWYTSAKNYEGTTITNLNVLNEVTNTGQPFWGLDANINNNSPFLVNNAPAAFTPGLTIKTTGTWSGLVATPANPVLYGTGFTGDTVNLFDGNNALGTAVVASGTWAYQANANLPLGWHTFKASQTNTGTPAYTSKYSLVSSYNALTILYVRANAGQSMTYGDTPSITYSLFTDAAATNLQAGVTPTGTPTFAGISSATNAATYPISYASGLTSASYNFAAGPAQNFTVNQATVSLSATKTYDGTSGLVGSQFTVSGVGGQTLNHSDATLQSKNVSDNASNFVSSLTLLDKTVGGTTYLAANYQLPNMAVRSASNTASISAATATFAAAKTYDGLLSLSAGQFSVQGANGETLDFSGTPVLNSKDVANNASNFVSGVSGLVNKTVGSNTYLASNYQMPGQSASSANNAVTISAASLSQVTASKVYDGLTTVGFAQMDTIAGVNGEGFTATAGTATISNKNVATANKTLTDLSGLSLTGVSGGIASNYDLSSLPAAGSNNAVTISAASLSQVTASKVYDGLTTVGFAQMDTIAGVNGEGFTATAGTATISNKNVATANKTLTDLSGLSLTGVSGGIASNYDLSSLPAAGSNNAVTINAASLSQVTASKVYDGLSTVNYAQMGVIAGVNGESFTTTGGTADVSDPNVATANKTLTDLSGLALSSSNGGLVSNYNLSSSLPAAGASNAVTITRSALTITALNASKLVGQSDPSFDLSYSGFVNGETPSVLSGVSVSRAGSATDARTYVAELVPTAISTNYDITPVNGNFTIVPIDTLLVTLGSSSKTYGASVSGLTATSAKYVDVVGNVLRPVTLTAGSNGNYTFTDGLGTTGSFTVTTSAGNASNVGNYGITLVNFVKSGTNFTYLASQAGNLAVNPLAANLGSANVSKVYNGNTAAQATISVSNKVGADDVSVLGLGSYTDNKNVGTMHTYSVVTQQLTGAAAGNYYLASLSTITGSNGVITAAPLTISGISASHKVYNGNVNATVSTASASMSGLVVGDDVTVNATGTFANKNVGTGKLVSLSSSYGGADLANYSITDQASTSANITPAALTVSGVTAANKTYDGTAVVNLNTANAVINGVIGADQVTVSAAGAFADKNVGMAKVVSVTAYTLGGSEGGNYSMSGQTTASADITPAALSISGITAKNKIYDGNTGATVSTLDAVKSGLIVGDVVTLSATGAFADANIGAGKLVSLNSVYGGADLGNYTITDQVSTVADILAAASASLAPPIPSMPLVLPAAKPPQANVANLDIAVPGADGSVAKVEVTLVTAPSDQMQGLINVVLPKGTEEAGTQIVIPVGEQIGQFASDVAARDVTVSLSNNLPLPNWIQFNRADLSFVLNGVPKGALPIGVAMVFKELRVVVQISEGASVNEAFSIK